MKQESGSKYLLGIRWACVCLVAVLAAVSFAFLASTPPTGAQKLRNEVKKEKVSAGSTINYTAIGDSLAFGTGATTPATGGYVSRFRDLLADQTDDTIILDNRGVVGMTSIQLLTAVQTDAAMRTSLQNAQIITFNIGGNDLLGARSLYKTLACGGTDGEGCLVTARESVIANWNLIIAEILSLNPTANIRTMDVYNPFVFEDRGQQTVAGGLDDLQVFQTYLNPVNAHMRSTAVSNGFSFARAARWMNSPNGDIDPGQGFGLLSADGIHPNDLGHTVLAQQVQLGIQSCLEPPANMVAWYQGENSSLDAVDFNNGTREGGVAFSNGKVGQAFDFDGVDGAILVPTFNLGTGYTIEFWMRADSTTPDFQNLVSNTLGTNVYGSLFLRSNLALDYFQSNISRGATGADTVATGQFAHIAITRSLNDGRTRVFRNGAFQFSTGIFTASYDHPVRVGGSISETGAPFNGVIDEIAFYNRTLGSIEIQAIANSDSDGKCYFGGFQIFPDTDTVQGGDTIDFEALGGTQPYAFSILANNSGGTINAATGEYTAGPTPATDTIRVTDAGLDTSDATITVTPTDVACPNANTRLWDGGGATNNWSDALNWCNNAAPVDGNTILFNGTSTKNATVDVTLGLGSSALNLNSGYTGTITMAAGVNATFGNSSFNSGTFTAADGTVSFPLVTVNIAGGTYNAGSGQSQIHVLFLASGTFNGSTGNVTNTFTSINGGTFTAPSGNMDCGGIVVNSGTFNHNNGTLTMVGGVPQFFDTASQTVFNVNVNSIDFGALGQGSTIRTITVLGTLTLNDGTFSNFLTVKATGPVVVSPTYGTVGAGSSGTLLIQDGKGPRSITLPAGAILPGVRVNDANATVNVSGSGTVTSNLFTLDTGDVTLNDATLAVGPSGNNGGYIQNGGTFNLGNGVLTNASGTFEFFRIDGGIFNGNTGTVSVDGNFFLNGGTFNATSGISRFKRGFTVGNAATFNAGTGTVEFVFNGVSPIALSLPGGGVNFNNLIYNVSVSHSGGNPIVNGTLTQIGGAASGGQIQLKGNMVMETNAFGGNTALLFNGTGNQTYANNGSQDNFSGTWTVNKPSGVLSLANDLTLLPSQTLTITSGEFSQGASSSLNIGTVAVGAGGFWRNNGTGDVTLGSGVTNAGNIDIDGTTISCDEADAILIRSTSPGVQRSWSGTGVFFVQDADVQDQAGSAAITAFASTNSGNTGANWTFNAACAPFVWDGGGATTNWSEAENWRRNLLPLTTTLVLFDGTSTKDAVVDSDVTVGGMQVSSGYTGTIFWSNLANHLTVGSLGITQNGGSIQAGMLTVNGDVTVTGGTLQMILASFLSINGDLSVSNANFAFAPNANTNLSGDFTLTSPITFFPGSHLILHSATASTLSVPNGTEFNSITINKTSNAGVSISPNANLIVNQSLTLTDGFLNGLGFEVRGPLNVGSGFDGGTGSIIIQNTPTTGGTIDAGAVLPAFLTLNSSTYTMSLGFGSDITFQDLILQNGTITASSNLSSSVIVNGSYQQFGGTFSYGSFVDQNLTFNSGFTLSGGNFRPITATTVDMNGSVTLLGGTFTSPSGTMFIGSSFSRSGSNTFTHNNGTVVFDEALDAQISLPDAPNTTVFNNVRFDTPNAKNIESSVSTFTAFTVNGSLEFLDGFVVSSPASSTIDARGNVTIGGGLDNGIFTTIKFGGSGNQTFTDNGGFEGFDWTLDKSGGTVNLATNLDIAAAPNDQTLSLTNGTITTGARKVVIGSDDTLVNGNGFVVGNLEQQFASQVNAVFNVGTASGPSPVNADIIAAGANLQGGSSSLTIGVTQGNRQGMHSLLSVGRFWTITETGDITADLTFNYPQADASGDEADYKMFRWNGTTRTEVTGNLDTVANTFFAAGVSEFSDWAIGILAPTAAPASVAGRVTDAAGRGIRNVTVTVQGSDAAIRSTSTNTFGYYRIGDLAAGDTYVLSVAARRHRFANPSRIIQLDADLTDENFVADSP